MKKNYVEWSSSIIYLLEFYSNITLISNYSNCAISSGEVKQNFYCLCYDHMHQKQF